MTIVSHRFRSREEWLAARRSDVTASVAGCLLDVSPFATPYQLWAEKTGRSPPVADNDAMKRGRWLEPAAITALREERPDWTVDYMPQFLDYYRDDEIRIGATPDAFATRPDRPGRGIVQIKTVADTRFRDEWRSGGEEGEDIVLPLWIAVQAIVEAKLTGCEWACVDVLVVGYGAELHVVDVDLHEGVWRRVCDATVEFWRMVEAGEHPPIDWMRDGATVEAVYRESESRAIDLTGDDGFDVMVETFNAGRLLRAEVDKRISGIRPHILHAIGSAERCLTDRYEITARTQIRDGRFSRPITIKERNRFNGRF